MLGNEVSKLQVRMPQVTGCIPAINSSHALTADVSVAETAKAAEFFLADGVVLTGSATGLKADTKELEGKRCNSCELAYFLYPFFFWGCGY